MTLYRHAVAWTPGDRYLLFEYAWVGADLGCLEEAEAVFRRLLDLSYNLPTTQYLLGMVLQKLGRHEEAITLFQDVIAKEPVHASVHYNLGISFAALKRSDEAIRAFAEAVRIEPDAVDASVNLGIAFAESGQLTATLAAGAM